MVARCPARAHLAAGPEWRAATDALVVWALLVEPAAVAVQTRAAPPSASLTRGVTNGWSFRFACASRTLQLFTNCAKLSTAAAERVSAPRVLSQQPGNQVVTRRRARARFLYSEFFIQIFNIRGFCSGQRRVEIYPFTHFAPSVLREGHNLTDIFSHVSRKRSRAPCRGVGHVRRQ